MAGISLDEDTNVKVNLKKKAPARNHDRGKSEGQMHFKKEKFSLYNGPDEELVTGKKRKSGLGSEFSSRTNSVEMFGNGAREQSQQEILNIRTERE